MNIFEITVYNIIQKNRLLFFFYIKLNLKNDLIKNRLLNLFVLQNDSFVGVFDIIKVWSLAEEIMLLDVVE